jgi:kinesin family protein C1
MCCDLSFSVLGDLSTSADGSLSAQAGMIPRAIARLFSYAEGAAARGWTYSFRASMLEIYNDELVNLLAVAPTAAAANGKKGDAAAAAAAPAPLRIVANDKSGRTIVAGLEPQNVTCASDVHALLSRGASARSVGATACNARSSRSHTVFTLYIDGVNTSLTGENKVQSTLALVDLAGSERLDRSEAASDPRLLKETQHINASLSALVTCMSSIANNDNNGKKTASKQHVSYRSSTLTFLLQDALGARGKDGPPARTLFFVNLAPERDSYAETMCTLRFAEKLKAVEMNATASVASSTSAATSSIALSSTASSAALAAAGAASAATTAAAAASSASSGSQTARVTRQRK